MERLVACMVDKMVAFSNRLVAIEERLIAILDWMIATMGSCRMMFTVETSNRLVAMLADRKVQ